MNERSSQRVTLRVSPCRELIHELKLHCMNFNYQEKSIVFVVCIYIYIHVTGVADGLAANLTS